MKLKEEKDLQQITGDYSKAIDYYQQKNLKKALDAFNKIIKTFENSEFYSVLEIQTRSKVYSNIIQSILNPKKIELKDADDYKWEGIFQLNSGNTEKAIEFLLKSKGKNDNNPYMHFLLAIAYYRASEKEKSIQHISKCIQLDPFYKILVYNEPDFETFKEDANFLELVG